MVVCGNVCCIAAVVKDSGFAIRSAVLFIFRSRLLLYSGFGVNRVQVVLSGFSVRLFCFVQATTLCRYGCMHFLAALLLVCV